MMYTTIQKWGNSHAIRLPKGVLELADLRENDRLEITAEENGLFIKLAQKKHKSLKERLADYSGDYICTEWETGKPQGKEIW